MRRISIPLSHFVFVAYPVPIEATRRRPQWEKCDEYTRNVFTYRLALGELGNTAHSMLAETGAAPRCQRTLSPHFVSLRPQNSVRFLGILCDASTQSKKHKNKAEGIGYTNLKSVACACFLGCVSSGFVTP